MKSSRVTMRDIAAEAGVAVSTVSKALRSDPSISPGQCRRIRAIAKRLNYAPDPMVAKLMAHLHHHRRRTDPDHLAWIDLWTEKPDNLYSSVLKGAKQRASELGYGLQIYKAAGMSPDRLLKTLACKSQWGVLIPPVPDSAMHLKWDLRGFAAISIGTSLREPSLHRVAPNHFQAAMLAFKKLSRGGSRRVGLVLSDSMNQRVDGRWLGGFLAASQLATQRVPPLVTEYGNAKSVAAWMEAERPDVVLIAEEWAKDAVAGLRAVEIRLLLPLESGRCSIDYQPTHLGRVAVEMAVAQIHRNERGVPAKPQTVLMDSLWNEQLSSEVSARPWKSGGGGGGNRTRE